MSASSSSSSMFTSPLSSPASSPSSSVLPAEPSYVERYTSFYSATPPPELLATLSSVLSARHIDHTVCPGKHKLVVSFLCPLLSSLSVQFHIRLYASALRPDLVIVEGQRREGCCVTFHHFWARLVSICKAAGLVHSLYEEKERNGAGQAEGVEEEEDSTVEFCKLATGLSMASAVSAPSVCTDPETSSVSRFTCDNSAFSILINLVDHGDISQQRDALRLLSLSLLSSPPTCDTVPYLALISRWAHSHTEDDERVTQLARLMLILTQRSSSSSSSSSDVSQFITECAADLFSLLCGSVSTAEAEQLSFIRLRGVRYLLATLSLLSVKGGEVLAEKVQEEERRVLERCTEFKDATIQHDSRAVLHRLSLVC